MLYVAVVDGVERQVEITAQGADQFTIFIDDERFELSARQIDANTLSIITAAEEAYEATFAVDGATQDVTQVYLGDAAVDVAVYDLRRQALRQAEAAVSAQDGPARILTPMPGKVVAVLVEEGQSVQAGAGLVVVEAMKMENELRAPKDGVVRQLKAQVGAAVDSGAVLLVIE
jgi:biotin carboxyl carrier protein